MAIATRFFKLEEARNSDVDSDEPFIFAHDYFSKKQNKVIKWYGVMESFDDFVDNIDDYPNANEMFTYHYKNNTDVSMNWGRLVFDFDIEGDDIKKVPKDFKKQMEDVIIETIDKHYENIDVKKIEFVWSTSQNPDKYSKHLTLKNFYLCDWIRMGVRFYDQLTRIWQSCDRWIPADRLFDKQIIRKNGGLRFVGCSKYGKNYKLVFDDPNHTLRDSTIKIYDNQRKKEQTVYLFNLKDDYDDVDIGDSVRSIGSTVTNGKKRSTMINVIDTSKEFDTDIYQTALKFVDKLCKNTFEPLKISGSLISLKRITENKCPLSGRFHENENAYIIISEKIDKYLVYYGCHRGCHKEDKKTILIGKINITIINNKPKTPKKISLSNALMSF